MSHDARPFRTTGATGLEIVGDEFGPASGPVVLLLHGGGQNRHAWKNTGERLAAEGHRVLALDARGHGDSAWCPDGQYDMRHFGDDVLTLVDRLGSQPTVVGASMGGLSAIDAQGRTPDRQLFRAVVLVDVTPEMEPDGVRRIMAFMQAHPEGFATLDDAADAIAAYNPDRPRSSSTAGLEKVLRRRPDGRWGWHWDPRFLVGKVDAVHGDDGEMRRRMAERGKAWLDAARRIEAPTLLVRGLLSDLVSDRTVASFRAAVPQAGFVEVERAGHMVAGDRNDAFADAVITFLRGLPPA